ncbi:Sec1-binding region of Mso1-domain-containing protein [Mariannaea sp. PMI_226]|nr:Sec1-binding region of Mso1-domain-containing protein [Mariannaea sp. PMI_226]
MSSWYSNLLTKTSSQISNLRSTLLSGEADGDTEDDTHVCRVLRGYYAEKGRPLPAWLPPDPKGAAQTPQPLLVNNNVGQRYGSLGSIPQQPGGGGLSSLWDSNGPGSGQPPTTQSLRAGRASMPNVGNDIQRRPVPKTYNTVGNVTQAAAAGGGGGAAGGGIAGASSAQNLLRQRLWGARTTSPSQPANSQGPFAPPSGGGNYEDRFAPGGMYDSSGGDKPVMSANAPWADGGDDFSGRPSRRQGLPSGPRQYR